MPPIAPNLRPEVQTCAPHDSTTLAALIYKDLTSPSRGGVSTEVRELITPYLIVDPTSDHFLHIHRAAAPLPAASKLSQTLSVEDFRDFLTHEAGPLQDQYLNFKTRGHTGCALVACEATARLNRRIRGCADNEVTADGIHQYSVVSVEGRNYWLDFTIDQFVAYHEIVERHRLFGSMRVVTPRPSYAGTLVMPLCRP